MLFCASKGDEMEVWKEREEKRCVRQMIPSLILHRSVSVMYTSIGCSAYAFPPQESVCYLLLCHFAGVCGNVCSALVPEESLSHTNHDCRSSDGPTTRSSEEEGEAERRRKGRGRQAKKMVDGSTIRLL